MSQSYAPVLVMSIQFQGSLDLEGLLIEISDGAVVVGCGHWASPIWVPSVKITDSASNVIVISSYLVLRSHWWLSKNWL